MVKKRRKVPSRPADNEPPAAAGGPRFTHFPHEGGRIDEQAEQELATAIRRLIPPRAPDNATRPETDAPRRRKSRRRFDPPQD
ncbi:hypothetical protein FHP25_29080 [Vineibacter terrae]|uniref:Uncharacterized protein n=1 Tax=Vineibacter terrae TaxID=2586908 RepID=A0A5C8PEL7_9HYPH|nr:hypothetical protein [Vineibacter terrae]TXL71594.1 hypothetical protein FHP25_29080 [Vineibacter terrae]